MFFFRYIVERGHMGNVTICSPVQKEKHVYTSNGRGIEIYITTNHAIEDNGEFLLNFEGELKRIA